MLLLKGLLTIRSGLGLRCVAAEIETSRIVLGLSWPLTCRMTLRTRLGCAVALLQLTITLLRDLRLICRLSRRSRSLLRRARNIRLKLRRKRIRISREPVSVVGILALLGILIILLTERCSRCRTRMSAITLVCITLSAITRLAVTLRIVAASGGLRCLGPLGLLWLAPRGGRLLLGWRPRRGPAGDLTLETVLGRHVQTPQT